MANPYQNASFRRKAAYFGAIVLLFAATVVARGVVELPGTKNTLAKWSIREQSERLDLNEMSQGEVELTGSAVRLLLTGSRGLFVCGLWLSANERQVKQDWNKLELNVRQITALQPHFITPWLFQSWNLTYNVSVEMDRLNDMYFYISRGINLLAEGESVNRNNPEIRYAIAFYYQNKFSVSDKVTTLRCMFQLSCIPKEERNYRRLLKGGQVDLDENGAFQQFCEKNPVLVRRLRESEIQYGKNSKGEFMKMVLAESPSDVVAFLKENEVLPNRFRDDEPGLEERLKQFPVVPPPFYRDPEEEMNPERVVGDGRANGLVAARVWFRYANEVIPLPSREPGPSPTNYRDPERKRRMPKQPMLIIFRQGPSRAQSYIAENLAKEGWIDREPWAIDPPKKERRWFKGVVQVKPTANSQEEWEVAHKMWQEHEIENGFMLDNDNRKRDYEEIVRRYVVKHGLASGRNIEAPGPNEDDPEKLEAHIASRILRFNAMNLQVTNLATFLVQSEVEKLDKTIQARKLFFEAEQAYKSGELTDSIRIYEKVLGSQQKPGIWGEILLTHPEFRKKDAVLEETYGQQIRYMKHYREDKKAELRRVTLGLFDAVRGISPASRATPAYVLTSDLILQAKGWDLSRVEPFYPPGPFDGLDPNGREWVPDHLKDRARETLGMAKGNQPQADNPGGK